VQPPFISFPSCHLLRACFGSLTTTLTALLTTPESADCVSRAVKLAPSFSLALAALLAGAAAAAPASVVLRNAADPGVVNPIAGLGTAGGGTDHGYGVWPECWASCLDAQCLQPNPNGCGNNTMRAIAQWFALGGRKLDSANGYRNQDAVGAAINAATSSGVLKREEIFFQVRARRRRLACVRARRRRFFASRSNPPRRDVRRPRSAASFRWATARPGTRQQSF